MIFSVITVSYNSAATIKDTIKSVLGQTHKDLEYIVVDGGSSDGTVDIIKKYSDRVSRWVSERDGGIYDAMNKGIRLSSGDVIGILNSDDIYQDSGVLKRVAQEFDDPGVECCYGDLFYVSKDLGSVVRTWVSGSYSDKAFRRGWHPPHPAFFVRRRAYEKFGAFDLRFPIAADYELMLRFLMKNRLKASYIPETLVRMRTGGESNRSVGNIIKANIECYRSWKVNGLKVCPLIVARKPFSKLRQL